MADDKIKIDVEVNGEKGLKDLRLELKDLEDQIVEAERNFVSMTDKFGKGSSQSEIAKQKLEMYQNQLKGVSLEITELEKGQEGLHNTISGIASGFAAAQGAAALFGTESEALEKQMLKVQAAMAVAEGIKGLKGFGDSLEDAGKLARNFINQLIGVERAQKIVTIATKAWNYVLNMNPIGLLIASITALIGVYYLLDKAFSDNKTEAEKLQEAAEALVETNKEAIRQIDNEITALSGLAKNEEEIIRLKEKKLTLTIQSTKAELEAAMAMAEQQKNELGFLDEITAKIGDAMGKEDVRKALQNKNAIDSIKLAQEKLAELQKNNADFTAFNNEQEQKRLDKSKAAADQKKAEDDKAHADFLAMNKARREAMEASIEQSNEINRKLLKEKKDEEERLAQEQADAEFAILEEKLRKKKEAEDKAKADKEKDDAMLLEAELKGLEASQSLAEGYFAFKTRAAKGNAAEELKIAKQQFAVQKSFSIARAIQDGIRSVQGALAQTATLGPGAIALAAINGAIAAGNVAQIAATQFDGGAVAATPDFSGGSSAFTQTPNISGGTQQSNVTQLNPDGTVANSNKTAAPVKAYVVETEVSATQKKVAKLSNQSKIG